MMKQQTTKIITVTQCDFCNTNNEWDFMWECDVCGADICNRHTYTIKKNKDEIAHICPNCISKLGLAL